MKIKFIKLSSYLIGLLLTAIGFSSCIEDLKETKESKESSSGNNEEGLIMYGTPTADYQISGKVTDVDNNPIEGISVSNKRNYSEVGVITDEDGDYKLDIRTFPGDLVLTIEDIDGVENGEFETKQRTETFENSDFTGGDGSWYDGKATRTVDIKLTKKTTP